MALFWVCECCLRKTCDVIWVGVKAGTGDKLSFSHSLFLYTFGLMYPNYMFVQKKKKSVLLLDQKLANYKTAWLLYGHLTGALNKCYWMEWKYLSHPASSSEEELQSTQVWLSSSFLSHFLFHFSWLKTSWLNIQFVDVLGRVVRYAVFLFCVFWFFFFSQGILFFSP